MTRRKTNHACNTGLKHIYLEVSVTQSHFQILPDGWNGLTRIDVAGFEGDALSRDLVR